MLQKVISGGQTGIDTIGLEEAKAAGIPTGGWMPKGWTTEIGPMPEFAMLYGLKEYDIPGYGPRTRKNIEDSDGTVVFGDLTTIGSALTVDLCGVLGKPVITNPTSERLLKWLREKKIQTLNVAGNRAGKLSTENRANAKQVLKEVFKQQNQQYETTNNYTRTNSKR